MKKLILKLTSASTGVVIEARAELGNILYKNFFDLRSEIGEIKVGCWVAGWVAGWLVQ